MLIAGEIGVPASARAERLPAPQTTDPVVSLAMDGDGSRLVVFYCADDASLNTNPGVAIEWTGQNWSTISSIITAQCHSPDVVVRGAVVSGIYLDDGLDAGTFCLGGACTGGSGLGADGLRNVHSPRIGHAFGFPYATYTQFQGAFAQDKLYLDQLYPGIATGASPPQTLGGNHCFPGPPQVCPSLVNPTVAGTPTIVYAAYDVPYFDCVGVRWETQASFGQLGCFFDFQSTLERHPEVAIVNGNPVVLWRETHDGGISTLVGGTWVGETPTQIESLTSDGAPWDLVRVVSSGTELYALLRRGSELVVRRWNGGLSWTPLWSETIAPFPSSPDIGFFDGRAYVAWVSGAAIAVEQLPVPEPSPPAGVAVSLLVLAALGRLRRGSGRQARRPRRSTATLASAAIAPDSDSGAGSSTEAPGAPPSTSGVSPKKATESDCVNRPTGSGVDRSKEFVKANGTTYRDRRVRPRPSRRR